MSAVPNHASGLDPHPIDARRLQVFVSSARHLSFAACAQQLSLTPSAVSHAIRSLEEDLACVLFQRHGPRVTLSRAGIRLLPIAEDLLRRMEALRGEVSSIDDESRHLRVGAPEFLCAGLLPRIMPDFFECFPSFGFEILRLSDPQMASEALTGRRADLVLSVRGQLPGDLVRRGLFSTGLDFYVAPFHSLAGAGRVEVADLARHRLLVPHASMLEALLASRVIDDPSPSRLWVLPSLESAREFARAGLGIAVLSASGEDIGGLQALSCAWPRVEVTCSAFWAGRSQLSWAAEAFLSFLESSEGF